MADTKERERQTLNIPPERYDEVIAQVAKANPPKVTRMTERLFRNEVLVLVFGENFQGWFEGFRQIFTILFVPVLFLLMLAWLLFISYFLWWAAFYRDAFGLSDGVLIALITTTTATVIGLFHYASRWLFEIRPKVRSTQTDSEPTEKSYSN